jgi:hypothetical protein
MVGGGLGVTAQDQSAPIGGRKLNVANLAIITWLFLAFGDGLSWWDVRHMFKHMMASFLFLSTN